MRCWRSSIQEVMCVRSDLADICMVREPIWGTDTVSPFSVWNLSNRRKKDRSDEVLQIVDGVDWQETPLSRDIISSLLQDCTKRKDLAAGRRMYSLIVWSGLDSSTFLGDHLIRMFSSCGSLLEAEQVFCKVSKPSLYTWNAIISAHTKLGDCERALELYHEMQEADMLPDKVTFLCALKACSSLEAKGKGMLIHAQIIRAGLALDVILGSSIIDMYSKCGRLDDARMVFDQLPNQNVVSWSAMIAGYAQHGCGILALEFFANMQQKGIDPSKVTLLYTLKACVSLVALEQGRLLHEDIIKNALESDVIVGSALVDMYAKCGGLDEAQKVFDRLSNRDLVSWGTMITAYTQHRHGLSAFELLEKMQHDGLKPDKVIFSSILKACGSMCAVEQGRLMHAQIVRRELQPDIVVGSCLVDMYAKCGSLDEARKVFNDLVHRNSVSWSSLIAGYVQNGDGLGAIELFVKMQQDGIKPGQLMFLCILKACSSIGALKQGRLIHAQIVEVGLNSDPVVGSTLIDMYAKCKTLDEARKVFDKLPNHDVVSWGAIISGYAQHGQSTCAIELFERMQQQGIKPTRVTFLCIIKACGSMKATRHGRLIHDQIIRNELEFDVIVGSTLIDMYSKCGSLEEARNTFDCLPIQDVVPWGAMIAGHAQHGHDLAALQLFDRMHKEGTEPSEITFLGILKACGSLGAIRQGRVIHDQLLKYGLQCNVVVESNLVGMYSKCGSLEDAHKVFDKLSIQNTVSWGALIAGYSWCGNCRMVWQCLEGMQQQGLKPVGVIFTSILAGCSHAGLLDEGCQHFKSMIEDHAITPSMEHYNCMVDLLARAGCLTEARDFLQTMPISPDLVAWTSLLSASRSYGDIDLGKRCFNEAIQMDCTDASGYVLMSNIYANAQMWQDVDNIQKLKDCTSAQKKPGMAWIEVSNQVHTFNVGDTSDPQNTMIHAKLKVLANLMKEEGYWPQLDLA